VWFSEVWSTSCTTGLNKSVIDSHREEPIDPKAHHVISIVWYYNGIKLRTSVKLWIDSMCYESAVRGIEDPLLGYICNNNMNTEISLRNQSNENKSRFKVYILLSVFDLLRLRSPADAATLVGNNSSAHRTIRKWAPLSHNKWDFLRRLKILP